MPDRFAASTRSAIMSRIRGRNTAPELLLRRALWVRGVRFRVHDKALTGRPDISHRGKRLAVFVDGCFWHGCPLHYQRPVANRDFWDAKLRRNRSRRKQVTTHLQAEGWRVLELWECEILEKTEKVADRVARIFKSRR